jgi:hypothetical protein
MFRNDEGDQLCLGWFMLNIETCISIMVTLHLEYVAALQLETPKRIMITRIDDKILYSQPNEVNILLLGFGGLIPVIAFIADQVMGFAPVCIWPFLSTLGAGSSFPFNILKLVRERGDGFLKFCGPLHAHLSFG